MSSNDSWNLPKLELRKGHPYSWGQKILSKLNAQKNTTLRHIIIKLRSQNQKGNFTSSKRKMTCHKQGNHHKTLVEFFNENSSDREKMDWYTTNTEEERKKSVNKEYYTQ